MQDAPRKLLHIPEKCATTTFPDANFTSLIVRIAHEKQLTAQKMQEQLGWQKQAARNQVMQPEEQAGPGGIFCGWK